MAKEKFAKVFAKGARVRVQCGDWGAGNAGTVAGRDPEDAKGRTFYAVAMDGQAPGAEPARIQSHLVVAAE